MTEKIRIAFWCADSLQNIEDFITFMFKNDYMPDDMYVALMKQIDVARYVTGIKSNK